MTGSRRSWRRRGLYTAIYEQGRVPHGPMAAAGTSGADGPVSNKAAIA